MNEVLLVNLPPVPSYQYDSAGTFYPATGIMVIGTILKNHGVSVTVIDGALDPDYQERCLAACGKELFIGFSVMTSQVPMALELSEKIKNAYPKSKIVWGGVHSTLFPEQTAANLNIDVAVVNEGNSTVLDLIEWAINRKPLSEILGIAYRDPAGQVCVNGPNAPDVIDQLPHFDFDLLDIERYLQAGSVWMREFRPEAGEPLRVMPILSGLGCCYKCQFCINVILRRRYRHRDAQSIIDEIKRLQERYQANAFVFYDEDFFINKKRLKEFLDLIEKEHLKFYWRAWARVNYFNERYLSSEMIDRLERNGLRSIVMGAESGSETVLQLISKGIKPADTRRSAEMLRSTKITPRYSFIVGLEGESRDDTIQTYQLCLDLLKANPRTDIAGPFVFRYYPGSPIFNRITQEYTIRMPAELTEWGESLGAEGYLDLDEMPWLWPGFEMETENFNRSIVLLGGLRRVLDRPGLTWIFRSLVSLAQWRLAHYAYRFHLEWWLYRLASEMRPSSIRQRLRGLLTNMKNTVEPKPQ